jgi:hypothetical protein
MSSKETHLQMIQGIISRMGQNSFSLKGWAVVLVSSLFALAAKDTNTKVAMVAYIPAIMFWFLDAYYLLQERLLRVLYESIRKLPADVDTDFSIDLELVAQQAPASIKPHLKYFCIVLSGSEAGFYIPLLAAVTAAGYIEGMFHNLMSQ